MNKKARHAKELEIITSYINECKSLNADIDNYKNLILDLERERNNIQQLELYKLQNPKAKVEELSRMRTKQEVNQDIHMYYESIQNCEKKLDKTICYSVNNNNYSSKLRDVEKELPYEIKNEFKLHKYIKDYTTMCNFSD